MAATFGRSKSTNKRFGDTPTMSDTTSDTTDPSDADREDEQLVYVTRKLRSQSGSNRHIYHTDEGCHCLQQCQDYRAVPLGHFPEGYMHECSYCSGEREQSTEPNDLHDRLLAADPDDVLGPVDPLREGQADD